MTKKGNEHEHAIEIPTFLDIARRIVPDETPSWLAAHLGWSSQGLQYDRLVDQYRPSKAETATRLDALTEALGLVQRELDDPSIRNLLEDAKYIKHLSGSSGMVRDLAQRADLAHISPGLTGAANQRYPIYLAQRYSAPHEWSRHGCISDRLSLVWQIWTRQP
jgi:hypothetical protein